LRSEWPDVFYGQPDTYTDTYTYTYTFFLKLGLELLAEKGKLGFITPNTYLMGTDTANLRYKLLSAGCLEQIVDLPQGIWRDANVDCALLFLSAESDEDKRQKHWVQVNIMGLHDTLDKLTGRDWLETLKQPQLRWLEDPQYKISIHTRPLRYAGNYQ
jgi:type I restriction enzyme M protein